MSERIAGIRWTPFRVPFAQEFSTGSSPGAPLKAREGLIVELQSDRGACGLGEASPLPERAEGDAAAAADLLREIGPLLVGVDWGSAWERLGALPERPGKQAVRCALDVAQLDLMSGAAGVPVAAQLVREYGGRTATAVPVNATIGARAPEDVRAAGARARTGGYPAVKLKVGVEETLEAERLRVAAAREALGPEVRLRLDANGAWTVAEALAMLAVLERYDLEWVEQPVADIPGLAAVRRETRVRIAADESVGDAASARSLLRADAADLLVLKPMSLGGLRPAAEIARFARSAGAAAVITTTIDAGIGTAAALQLAATLPAPAPACGLATASLLAADLVRRPLLIEEGAMRLPEAPGLGVQLDREQLARYCSGAVGECGELRAAAP